MHCKLCPWSFVYILPCLITVSYFHFEREYKNLTVKSVVCTVIASVVRVSHRISLLDTISDTRPAPTARISLFTIRFGLKPQDVPKISTQIRFPLSYHADGVQRKPGET